jgi:translation elongation factor EF-1alpha
VQEVGKKLVGKVAHYYSKISVAVIELSDELKLGDSISIEGVTTNIQQPVDSMQIEHQNIPRAKAGESVGLRVSQKVREGDLVYRVG